MPGIVLTTSDGEAGEAQVEEADDEEDDKYEDDAYNAPIEERERVYGKNVLPTRKTKSLLQLMWLALKDKVLVSFHR